ncbi:DUF1156 domain-containing protein [Desulfovibrio piger]|uniref:DUF1156 domain-containing protein n=1 Tax=Desulfovibrio piger TaxID=901 RepID=A0A848CD25_9BACT|nr:DUF1156 domain-containing protein [Desulfovibrio piger]NME52228.1 DUF1156 domain-containing protein [Desulfovibrio piger]
MHSIKTPKKLIEVALPLDAINAAAAREKSIRHGHPSTLHLWWARRPLAAARAVIFAQMVNDPGYERQYQRGMNKEAAARERERLFGIIEDLVKWENTTNEDVLERARAEIRKSWQETCKLNRDHPQAAELFDPDKLPAFHDPFAGGGALPLEAQRLGLEAWASDLNPVAVTINKAMIEIPPRLAGRKPVGPVPPSTQKALPISDWKGAQGLAEDVRRYGHWMREEAQKRIGHLYPQVEITADMAQERPDLQEYVGKKLTVIAWLWARTVKSPNPAFAHVDVPLASTFVLSSKAGKEAWVEPVVDGDSYCFTVRMGKPPEAAKRGTKSSGRGANFLCLLSKSPIEGKYIKAEGQVQRIGARLMAIVAEGKRGRVYLSPLPEQEELASTAMPQWRPHGEVPSRLTGGTCVPYGLKEWGDLFTPRQLVALTTFSDLVQEAIIRCHQDALAAGMGDDGLGLEAGGTGAQAYAEAVGVYLGLAVSRLTDICNALCRWEVTKTQVRNLFGRQAIPMIWDFAENNVFAGAAGDYGTSLSNLVKSFQSLPQNVPASAVQIDAQTQNVSLRKIVSTDPPYYDNIGYADLSDFFYVWMRRTLRSIFPGLYGTMSVPKTEELVATPYRHGNKEEAEAFFLQGMSQAIRNLAEHAHPAFPVTIYYAFKQSETQVDSGTSSTGWETFLEAVLRAGFAICGTWPMRTELGNRMISSGTNALASSIVLVCRKRPDDAPSISRREFLRELNDVLPVAFEEMTRGGVNSPVAPVDLSQAIIGPGMAVFSKYKTVLEADGSPMSVKTALRIINRFFGEDDDFDNDTMFCLDWFAANGWAAGKFGEADVLARAKGTSAAGLAQAGVAESGGGEVRLLRWQEMPDGWDPVHDARKPVWESLHQLIRHLNLHGEGAAGALLARCGTQTGAIRALAYRLYTLCERKGWADDARAYNELVVAWSDIEQASLQASVPQPEQGSLL